VFENYKIRILKSYEMETLTIKIPDQIDTKTFDVRIYLAAKLYEDAILSAGQAAKLAGISKKGFIEIIGRYGVSVFGNSISDLNSDIANA
jgi:predicted HTH domain antitoxin